jgi:hypothetical protein
MRRRQLVIALSAAALFGLAAVPASAELRRVAVTLVTGQTVEVTVDVPPGASVQSVALPAMPAPVASVTDLGPAAPAATATPSPTATATPSPTATPAAPNVGAGTGSTGARAKKKGKEEQEQTDKAKPKRAKKPADANTQSGSGTLEPPADDAAGAKDGADAPTKNRDGSPTLQNPTVSVATPGPARIGVPNFFIEKFRIPPFLLSIYQAAGIEYGVRWEVLAAINEIETDYGRNLNVSSAGALGWMQFMPDTWDMYGVDGNRDGKKDPYNPVDAIFAAARYLKAAGADRDLRTAIFAYNHADWYVDSVLLRARLIGGLPNDLVGSLTGLTQGRFPVAAKATYAKAVTRRDLKVARGGANAAYVVDANGERNGIDVFSRAGAPVVAVNDGRIVRVGRNARLGRFVKLQDVYGNTYTYGHLGRVAASYATPKKRKAGKRAIIRELRLPAPDAAPKRAASETTEAESQARAREETKQRARARRASRATRPLKERLFAHPGRTSGAAAPGKLQGAGAAPDFADYLQRMFGLDRGDIRMKPLRAGARVPAGTILGRLAARTPRRAPHLLFEIRPAGRGAPRVDPKPILDGWKLLESTAIYRAAGRNPFFGADAETPTVGQILLMGKDALVERVLADPNVQVYGCGRHDIRTGQIDRRVLSTLEFLAASGLKPTVTSLRCGHSYLTTSGNVSEHSTGTAVDIAAINGIPILGHQGSGSIAELTIQRLLTLQGAMKPHQIISLMEFPGTDNTLAMADHDDHIHVGFRPQFGANRTASRQLDAILKPEQWTKLIERLGQIENPKVPKTPSKYATDADDRASTAHKGE